MKNVIALLGLLGTAIIILFGNNLSGCNDKKPGNGRNINFNDESSGNYIEGDNITYLPPAIQPVKDTDDAINGLSLEFKKLREELEKKNNEEHYVYPLTKGKKNRKNKDDYLKSRYPKILKISDNIGNVWDWQNFTSSKGDVSPLYATERSVYVGQELVFTVEAYDPTKTGLQYYLSVIPSNSGWLDNNKISYKLKDKDVSEKTKVQISVKSNSKYRAVAGNESDHWVTIYYNVLP
jgi:hypothetical protein